MEVLTTKDIQEYRPEYKEDFKKLNLEWITQFFKLSEADKQLLDDPQGHIIDKGGYIFFVKEDNHIVGTCALVRENNKRYEITKMAVSPQYQGRHIGLTLLNNAVEKAKQLGARQVYLISSTKLKASLEMYRNVGFREMPHDPEMSIYDGSDVKMILNLK